MTTPTFTQKLLFTGSISYLDELQTPRAAHARRHVESASRGRARSFSNAAEIFMREAILMKLGTYLESVEYYPPTKGKVTSGKTVPVRQ